MVGTRSQDPAKFNHITKNVLKDGENLKGCLKNAGIKTYRELLDVGRDHNKVNAMKWKNPQTQRDEQLSDEDKEELKDLKNFINWLQNNHGTIGNFDIDVIAKASRALFLVFMTLNPAERRATSPDGTVDYDIIQEVIILEETHALLKPLHLMPLRRSCPSIQRMYPNSSLQLSGMNGTYSSRSTSSCPVFRNWLNQDMSCPMLLPIPMRWLFRRRKIRRYFRLARNELQHE